MANQTWERVANVAVVAIGVATLAVVAQHMWFGSRPAVRAASPYQQGERLDLLSDEEVTGAPRTVLIVLQSGCRACTDSMPFYRRLVDLANARPDATRVVVMSLNPLKESRRHIEEHGLAPNRLLQYPMTVVPRMTVTPTLFILDEQLRVLEIWEGQLTESEEAAVERLVFVATTR